MNSGAIKVSKNCDASIITWIEANINPDYKIIESNSDSIYYIADSDLFYSDKLYSVGTYRVYCVIITTENTFKLKLESWSYVKL